jgi:ABC-2 type transport system permease protein
MKILGLLRAFLVRDFLQEMSYRTNFIMQWVGVAASLTVWYFLGTFFARFPQLAESLGGMDYFSYSVVGIAFLRYLSNINSTFAGKVRQEQTAGTLEAMLVSPNGTPTLVLLSSAYQMLSSSLWILAWLFLGRLFGATFHLPALIPALLMLIVVMASFASIGILSAGMVIYFKRGDPVTWLLASGSTLLGGIFFPVSILPERAQMLARLLPITHAVEGFRDLIVKQASLAEIWPNLQFLLIFAAIFLPLGLSIFYLALRRARVEGTLIQY